MKKISFELKICSLLFLGVLLITGCKDSQKSAAFWPMALSGTENPQTASTATPVETVQPGSFTSFGLTSPQVTGTIEGTNITIMVPANTPSLSSFIATFVHNGASVSINGTSQVSGVTVNDFTSPLTYTVTDKDGTTRTYTVTVKRYYPIAGTGITKCYDSAGTEITCGNSNYPNQDGDSKKPQPSFTGPTQNATYPNDYTTTDNIIGNVWKTCTEGLSGADCGTGTATTYANQAAATTACTTLNSANGGNGYAGRTDWRLPNLEEAASLLDFSKFGSFIDSTKFPNTITFWTSTINNTYAWKVIYNQQVFIYTMGTTLPVKCIAGTSQYSYTFTDNGDGTMTDAKRGLVWQKCAYGQSGTDTCSSEGTGLNWQSALQTCNSMNLAGRKWRLPNAKEIISSINYQNLTGPLDMASQTILIQNAYQSSTTIPQHLNYQTVAIFTIGLRASSSVGFSSYYLFPSSSLLEMQSENSTVFGSKSQVHSTRCVSDL